MILNDLIGIDEIDTDLIEIEYIKKHEIFTTRIDLT